MKNSFLSLLAMVIFFAISFNSGAQNARDNVEVLQVALEDDIVDIAIGSEAHSTLVAAVQAAGLVETLKSDGPFTVFAPTNEAFDKLPKGTLGTLLKPENKEMLTNILTYHVVAGDLDANAVVAAIKSGNGVANVITLNGGKLQAMIADGKVVLKDENGNSSTVIAADLKGSNGTIHVIDTVVLPKS